MAMETKVEQYLRSPHPLLPESQVKYLQDELRKLERVLQTVNDALAELGNRVSTLENP